jgi:hypothetical protein
MKVAKKLLSIASCFFMVGICLKFSEKSLSNYFLNEALEVSLRATAAAGIGSSPPPLCSIEDLKNGKWTHATYSKAPYIPMRGEVQQNTCPNFNPNADTWQTWEWLPDEAASGKCTFSNFDVDLYCAHAKNKTIAIIGDSISFDHYLSLTHLLGIPQALPRVRSTDTLLVSDTCNGTSKLIGKRDFYLNSVGPIIQDHSPDVLILNRGAHYTPDKVLLQAMSQNLIPQLEEWQFKKSASSSSTAASSKTKQKKKDSLLIWRTTVPGHPNCEQYTEPADSVEEMERIINEHSNITQQKYYWDKFKDQNKLVLNLLRDSSLVYDIMDAYNIDILRPDAHVSSKDCLHTCLPGHDIYSVISQHMFQLEFG